MKIQISIRQRSPKGGLAIDLTNDFSSTEKGDASVINNMPFDMNYDDAVYKIQNMSISAIEEKGEIFPLAAISKELLIGGRPEVFVVGEYVHIIYMMKEMPEDKFMNPSEWVFIINEDFPPELLGNYRIF